MRAWLALRANEIPFEEIFTPLSNRKVDKDRILSFSGAGKVPVLVDGDVIIWDSLAIIEYLAETYPDSRLWPLDRGARAHARAISAELHSGFMALRRECDMNLHRPAGPVVLSDDARADVARIQEIWADCHARYGGDGAFLFGAFSAADAMYAPVVHRFRTYAVSVIAEARPYVDAMMSLPAFQQWTREGLAEASAIG